MFSDNITDTYNVNVITGHLHLNLMSLITDVWYISKISDIYKNIENVPYFPYFQKYCDIFQPWILQLELSCICLLLYWNFWILNRHQHYKLQKSLMTTRPKATAVPGVKTTAVKMFWSLYNVIDSSFNMTVILQQTQITDIHDWYIQITDKEALPM